MSVHFKAKARAGLVTIATTIIPSPPITTNVQQWALSRGVPSLVLLPARCVERRPPSTVAHTLRHEYDHRLLANQWERYLVPVSNATLHGSNGLIGLTDGSLSAESVYGSKFVMGETAYRRLRRREVVRKEGAFFSLVVNWSAGGNYYHWFQNTLTRLYGIQKLLPPETRFIVPADLKPFQLESLALAGVAPSQVDYYDGTADWKLETLYFAPAVSNSGSYRAEVDLWLKERILTGLGIASTESKNRIYLSRRAAPTRRVLNESAVEAVLAPFGFETCVAEELTFRQQVSLFAEAEMVFAPHGAGLTNMLFSPPGMTVLDMIQRSWSTQAYSFWAMAEELGHHYWYFETEARPRPGFQDDTHIPIDILEDTMTAMANKRGW